MMDVWLHPEYLLARVNEMPVFADLELLEGLGLGDAVAGHVAGDGGEVDAAACDHEDVEHLV